MNKLEQIPQKEHAAKLGFTDWLKASEELGNTALSALIKDMDPGISSGNAKRLITERLVQIGLPTQSIAIVSTQQFLSNPEAILAQIPRGDYYFSSIVPGTQLTHGTSDEELVNFIATNCKQNPDFLNKEVYISHNGEAVMSGHILINDDDINSIYAEFTNSNFNEFHRGIHNPEISVSRKNNRFDWSFHGELAAEDWRNDEKFSCNDIIYLSRPQMAAYAYESISCIPNDDGNYLPGYYEVLLERQDNNSLRPAFIEAVLKN